MRAFLYDTLITSADLQSDLGGDEGIKTRVIPRRSKEEVATLAVPFLVFGLGNSTAMGLCDSTADDPQDRDADHQFFQVWVHDKGGSYKRVDNIIPKVVACLKGAQSPADGIVTIEYLETSAEFNNETYGTNFRYIRFQAVKMNGGN
jgi:hypothetical protein